MLFVKGKGARRVSASLLLIISYGFCLLFLYIPAKIIVNIIGIQAYPAFAEPCLARTYPAPANVRMEKMKNKAREIFVLIVSNTPSLFRWSPAAHKRSYPPAHRLHGVRPAAFAFSNVVGE